MFGINDVYLYKSDELDFNYNGVTLRDWEDEPEVNRVINGTYSFSGVYAINGLNASQIKEDSILKVYCPDRTWQPFRITIKGKTLNNIEISGFHICYDANRNFIENFFESNGSGLAIMSGLERNLTFKQPFSYASDIVTTHQFTAKQGAPIDVLIGSNNGGQNLTGVTAGELDMDMFNLKLKQRLGQDRGFRIDFGINLDSVIETIDVSGIANSLYLVGATPEGDYDVEQDPITYRYLEVKGVNDTDRIIKKRENSSCETMDELKKWGQSLFDKDKIHLPKVTHEISIVDLAQTNEYQSYLNLVELQIGDTVYCNLSEIDIEVQERLIEYTWHPRTGEYQSLVLGNSMEMYSSVMNSTVDTVRKELEVQSEILKEKIINASNLITGSSGGYVRFRPKNKPSEILIMDTDNVNTAKEVWRWNLGGLGHSKNGVNGPFDAAMTADGQIVADVITAGTFNAEMLRVGFNGIGDTLQLVNNALVIYNAKNKIMELTKTGLEFWEDKTKLARIGTAGKIGINGTADFGKDKTGEGVFISLDQAAELFQIDDGKGYGIGLYKGGRINSAVDPSHAAGWVHQGNMGIDGTLNVNKLMVDGKEVIGGSGGSGGGTPPSLTTEQEKNAWEIWVFLKDRGWSEQAVAGVLGNMEQESGIMPDISEGGGGPGYGLVQWTSPNASESGRDYVQRKLKTAGIKGDYRTIKVQLQLLEWDMLNGQYIPTSEYPYSASQFKKLTDITTATVAFERNFERPAATHPERVSMAKSWYKKLHGLIAVGKYGMPVPSGYQITSWFGNRDNPTDPGNVETHKGMDFADKLGTAIFAVEDGEVIASLPTASSGGFGEYIVIKHADGNFTGYAHLNSRSVPTGKKVTKGQQIGNMGTTGESTGVHLHFSVGTALWGPYQDPAPFLGLIRPN
ncbi:Phage peptidoglycan binding endopeptidase [Brachybacterium faecium]|nr:Phage peptidoglycan binding endopeptidase [Brachybacterium faecium]